MPYGIVGGVVYHDVDNNGAYTPGTDTPLAGSRIELYNQAGQLVNLQITAANGQYNFSFLEPNRNYRVKSSPPPGYAPSLYNDITIFVTAGTPVTINFGHQPYNYQYLPAVQRQQ